MNVKHVDHGTQLANQDQRQLLPTARCPCTEPHPVCLRSSSALNNAIQLALASVHKEVSLSLNSPHQ